MSTDITERAAVIVRGADQNRPTLPRRRTGLREVRRPEERRPRAVILTMALVLALGPTVGRAPARAQVSTSPPAPTVASVLEAQLSLLEGQFVAAAEAMPADLYAFVPTDGEFSGARTFALQVKHAATASIIFYSTILERDLPPGVSIAGAANGPSDVRDKGQILKYLQDSFALGREALATLTPDNAVTPLAASPIPLMNTRLSLATWACAHAWNHYGQMVAYLRMNGIVPPASRGQPPANPSTGGTRGE